jgi:predicted transcriptional regulator
MRYTLTRWVVFLCLLMPLTGTAHADWAEEIEGLERKDGLFPIYVDTAKGRVLAELSRDEVGHLGRLIYTARLTSGLGSNPIGLDRGLGTGSYLLRFSQVGESVFAEFENTRYRAIGAGPEEAAATVQSFGRSVVWQTEIVAETDDAVLIDLSDFLKRDPIGAARRLSSANQGSFSIDKSRSAPLADSALAFPENIEIDALLTLSSSAPGNEVRATAPYSQAVTLTVHHSFIALPDEGYTPRMADERSGAIDLPVYHTAAPLDESVYRAFAIRHRLERIDPIAESGPVVEPIVFYVDRGAPEQIREALIEGGNWWAEAFEAAGFEDAYRVELLPEGVHPLDSRYNVIQWVHRQTRGWSYGASVVDPRTGEILKGHVILGSQRVRQDRMIFEGLLGRDQTGTGGVDDPLEMALARVRQLSAHEIGHTIGLLHNFAASTNDRASVMDYPAPLVTLDGQGGFDVSQAYDVGIGEWDKISVRWLYSQYADPADEALGLEAILEDARDQGLLYISDRHARGVNSAHPLANLWDNGEDPTAMLSETLRVRDTALAGFGSNVMAEGLPLSSIRDAFPPIYLYHRYQVEAAAKALGGVMFEYELNGPFAAGLQPHDTEAQWAALEALLETIDPQRLDVPDDIASLLAPSPYVDYDAIAQREHFETDQYPAFSRSNAAAAAARISFAAMLSEARLARMADQSARDGEQLSPQDVLDGINSIIFSSGRDEGPRLTPVREAVQNEYVSQLLRLAASDTVSAAAIARAELTRLEGVLGRRLGGTSVHRQWLQAQITAGLAAIDEGRTVEALNTDIPPGSPIGMDGCFHCDSGDLMGLR